MFLSLSLKITVPLFLFVIPPSGYMGVSYGSDDTPTRCFNAPNSYQMGWYGNQVNDWDPYNTDLGQKQTWTMNGIIDYKTDGTNPNTIVLRIRNPYVAGDEAGEYYVGYNLARGCNSGTGMYSVFVLHQDILVHMFVPR